MCQNISSKIEIKALFHFSHYKVNETLIFHSDESTRAKAMKNIRFEEAYVVNISTKFQLYPPYGSEEMIFVHFFSQI